MTNYNLIIPDIHQNLDRLNQILASEDAKSAKEIIFLGDYFDSFDYDFYTPEMCKFLNKNIDNDRYTFLIGNHDAHYLTKVKQYVCSGWSFQKQSIVDVTLDKAFLRKIKPFKYEKIAGKHFLFSHAGLHPSFTPFCFDEMLKGSSGYSIVETEPVKEWFLYKEREIKDSIFMNEYNVWLGAGKDRGGWEIHGGVTWMDWCSFREIEFLNQIVGHSTHSRPQSYNTPQGDINLNLDTNLKHYAKIDLDTAEVEVMSIVGRVA